jgi:hypothetical protein
MSETIDKIAAAIDKALEAKPKLNTTDLIFAAVVEFDPSAAPPKDDVAALKRAQSKWERAFKADYSERAAKVKWSEHLADSKLDHLDPATRTRGMESLISEYASKQLVAKSKMGEASIEAAKVANTLVKRLAPAAERWLKQRIEAERAEAQRFGLEPIPSAVTSALKDFVNRLKGPPFQGYSGYPPSSFCFFLNLN